MFLKVYFKYNMHFYLIYVLLFLLIGYASAKDVAAKIAESHDINDPIIKKLDINDMGFINILDNNKGIESLRIQIQRHDYN